MGRVRVQDLRTELGQGVGSRPKDRAGTGCGFKTSGQSWDRVWVQDLRTELGQGRVLGIRTELVC